MLATLLHLTKAWCISDECNPGLSIPSGISIIFFTNFFMKKDMAKKIFRIPAMHMHCDYQCHDLKSQTNALKATRLVHAQFL
jgi:hypothetical protein